jgi:heme/copper-type cytochrome/quinol oxidase subunit 1
MRIAKLFGALAIIQIVLALFDREPVDLHVHATYFVIGRTYLLIAFATISVSLALIYLATSRWLRPLKDSLGFTHFALTTLGFLLLWLSLFVIRFLSTNDLAQPITNSLPRLAIVLGLFFFAAGAIAFVANCVWTAFTMFRWHRS